MTQGNHGNVVDAVAELPCLPAEPNWSTRSASLDLAVNRCSPDSECGNVIHYDGYYGPTEPPAWADVLSESEPCFDNDHVLNGYCNETNHKSDFSYIYYNTEYSYSNDLIFAYITRHEMGHVWGLRHPACSVVSVMKDGTCGTVYGYLTTHDISDMNAKY